LKKNPLFINSGADQTLFLAPMASITNSAFRRLVAGFGGYDALYTEMLHGRGLLGRKVADAPYSKKREIEGRLIYQLLLTGEEDIPKIVDTLRPQEPFGLDLNAGCSARSVTRYGSGFALFENPKKLSAVIASLRKEWDGSLSVKCRLGENSQEWPKYFKEVLAILESCGCDFITVHPRFSKEKLKRPPVWNCIPWLKETTRLPVVISGDIMGPGTVRDNPDTLGLADGLMLGRIAIAKPWIFQTFRGEQTKPDYAETWKRYCTYVAEDFQPFQVIGQLKGFLAFFARNFYHSHEFFKKVNSSKDLDTLNKRTLEFLESSPIMVEEPSFSGL
jgi:tRNA-dihydrouridine synthase B